MNDHSRRPTVSVAALAAELCVAPERVEQVLDGMVAVGLFTRSDVSEPLSSDAAATVRLLVADERGGS